MLSYAAREKLFTASTMLTATIVAALFWCAALPFGALLAGRIGRKRVLIAGTLGITVWAYPYFALVESGSRVGLFIGSIVAALCIASVVSLVAVLTLRSLHPGTRRPARRYRPGESCGVAPGADAHGFLAWGCRVHAACSAQWCG
ncbi:hypothetical protein ABZ370_40355 [Streptomyces sp. NPDC005962]|uniref:hypothetical protein n=1 Tax=Streptomyces sp. NPDC005962 TaxID=3154466 RepID=UPI0033E48D0B